MKKLLLISLHIVLNTQTNPRTLYIVPQTQSFKLTVIVTPYHYHSSDPNKERVVGFIITRCRYHSLHLAMVVQFCI